MHNKCQGCSPFCLCYLVLSCLFFPVEDCGCVCPVILCIPGRSWPFCWMSWWSQWLHQISREEKCTLWYTLLTGYHTYPAHLQVCPICTYTVRHVYLAVCSACRLFPTLFVALYSLIPCLLLFCCFRSLQLPHTDDLPPHLPQLLKHITAWNGAKASSSLQCECVQECAEASVCVCVCVSGEAVLCKWVTLLPHPAHSHPASICPHNHEHPHLTHSPHTTCPHFYPFSSSFFILF